MTDGARFLKTKFWRPKSGPDVPKSGLNLGFLPIGLLVFLENAYSDSLQHCLTSSRSKINEKKIQGSNVGQKGQNRVRN